MSSSMNLASAHGGEGDQLQVAWAAIRAGLRADVGTRTFDHWLKPVELVGYCDTDKAVRLSLPSDFMASWVSSHYTDRLTLAWRAMLPHVDDFLPVHNIESLTQLAQQLKAAR